MIVFLEDAYERGVPRQASAVYRLRRDRIQTQLADKFANARRADVRPEKRPRPKSPDPPNSRRCADGR
jgi:hypothetical protein